MKFAFLLYHSRSGSTFLARQMAVASKHVFVFPELLFIERLIMLGDRRVSTLTRNAVRRIVAADKQLAGLSIPAASVSDIVYRNRARGVRSILLDLVRQCSEQTFQDIRVIVVKNGGLIRYVREIGVEFEHPLFIHICRDPRAVVNSCIHSVRPYFPGEVMDRGDVRYSTHRWLHYVRSASGIADSGVAFREVSYERLVTATARVTRELCDFLGVSVETNERAQYAVPPAELVIHERYGSGADVTRIASWRTSLRFREGAVIEWITRQELVERGFEAYFLRDTNRYMLYLLLARSVVDEALHTTRYYLCRVRYYARRPSAALERMNLQRDRLRNR